MSAPGIAIAPRRDDLRGDVDDGAAVSTREMLAAIDWATITSLAEAIRADWPGAKIDRIARQLRHARAVIAAVAPAVCQACGALNIHWLTADATRLPCAACGHRIILVAGAVATPIDRASAVLPQADAAKTGEAQ